jgi:DNA replication and repair protein RecF
MWLREIEADRLRNLRAVSIDLSSGLTVVTGRNGEGKSSLLEAIYLLATSRSFRTRRTEEYICREGGPLRVAGRVAWRGGEVQLTVITDDSERRLIVNGVDSDLEAYLGHLDVIDLSWDRMRVLQGGPDDRRRFLDRGVVGLEPSFLKSLGEYRRVLGHRNALLRALGGGAGSGRMAELETWNERLAEAAARIHGRRREYAVMLSSRLGEAGRVLWQEGEEIRVRYRGSPATSMMREPEEFRDALLEALAGSRDREIGLGYTVHGPHRDELAVELDGIDLRKFGSAGQVRSAMVALKLAKLDLLGKKRGETPIFIMDDYDSDLDEPRAAALAAHLHEGKFQAVVATSKVGLADGLGVPFDRVRMQAGAARRD